MEVSDMAKYEGFEFDPKLNRLLGTLAFVNGESDIEQKEVPFDNPYDAPHPGFHVRKVKISTGTKSYAMYIPKKFPPFGNGVILFVPDVIAALDYMKDNGYDQIAEETDTTFIALEASGAGWTEWELNEALEYARAVYVAQDVRDLCAVNEAGYSVIGIGEASYAAAIFALLYSSVIAAFACVDLPKIDPELIEQIGGLPADGNPMKTKLQVPLSSWIVGENDQLIPYLREANDTGEGLTADKYVLYTQLPRPCNETINVQECGEVRYSKSKELVADNYYDLVTTLVNYVNSFRRQPGIGEKFYRRTQTQDELRVKEFERVIGGIKRRWYIYLPTEYGKIEGKKYPVVMGLHGVCSTGLDFQRISEWNRLAEAKKIIMIYPFGYMRRFGPVMAPTVAWDYDDDDVQFLREIVEEVKKTYSVDCERIYLTGHSNGSGMTQAVLRKDPTLFAAYAPIGLTEGELTDQGDVLAPPIPHHVKCPVWLLKGEFDIGQAASLEEDSTNANMIRRWCDLNECDYQDARTYTNGAYETTSYYDKEHVPMVRFTKVLGMYHAFNPEMSRLIWDYFCHFKRGEDDGVEYMG